MMNWLTLYIDVPFATFRESRAREYGKTSMAPPPSTVYGMLLSLVGETNLYQHCGVRLAIAMLQKPNKFKVIRQLRRFKETQLSHPRNQAPAYQEVLSNIKLMVWIASDEENQLPTLAERVEEAIMDPGSMNRFGCLYLGESDNLVNIVKIVSQDHCQTQKWWLVQHEQGCLTLPYWVDHAGSRGTRWLRYQLQNLESLSPPELAWTTIQPPSEENARISV